MYLVIVCALIRVRACNRQWHHYRYITLLIYPRYYPLRPTCFPRYFLHLCYDWSLCLAPSLPLMVWLRCRFIQAATTLSIVSEFLHHSPALRTVFNQLARTGFLAAVDGLEPSLISLLHSCCSCG